MEWWNGGMVEWMHVLYQVHFWCMHVGNNCIRVVAEISIMGR